MIVGPRRLPNRPADRPPGDHGKVRRWLDGCRCERCEATITYVRAIAHRNAEPYGRLPVDLDLFGVEHGTARGFDLFGCGCAPCHCASKREKRDYAARRIERRNAG